MADDRQQKINLIQRLGNMFRVVIDKPPLVTTERESVSYMDSTLFELNPARIQKYKDYTEMDVEVCELSSALDLYADFVTSSQMGNDATDTYNIEFIEEGKFTKENDACADLEDRLALKQQLWFMTRNLVCYGDAFYEIVASPDQIVKLKYLPEDTVFINYIAGTQKKNPLLPYYQRDKETLQRVAEFAPWEIIHYKISDEDYGVDYSVLGPARRLYRILRMLEDTLLITRIARSNQRAVYKIDVSGMSEQESTEYIRKLKILNKRKVFFSQTGKMRQEIDPLQPQEDVYVPIRKGGVGGDYQVIAGEAHLGEIRDIWYFHSKLFAATKVPKAYLGFESDVNAKATLVQQHVAFVKAVKRYRYAVAEGLKKLYRMNFLMNGIDPTVFEWGVKFPAIGSPDEEAAWGVERLKAEVIKLYGDAGAQLPREYIVKRLMMNLSSDEAEELLKQMEKEDEEREKNNPFAAMAPAGAPGAKNTALPPGAENPAVPGAPGQMTAADKARFIKGAPGKPKESAIEDVMRRLEDSPLIRKQAERIESIYKMHRQGRSRYEIY